MALGVATAVQIEGVLGVLGVIEMVLFVEFVEFAEFVKTLHFVKRSEVGDSEVDLVGIVAARMDQRHSLNYSELPEVRVVVA